MSMGYGSGYADVIKDKDLRALCPLEHREFMMQINNSDTTLEDVARDIDYEYDGLSKEIRTAYERLCNAFNKKTKLTLYLGYHSEDEGSTYDEVTGAYYGVNGMYEMTKAGKKHKDIIQRCHYVIYG